jgi:hypothetical protein
MYSPSETNQFVTEFEEKYLKIKQERKTIEEKIMSDFYKRITVFTERAK